MPKLIHTTPKYRHHKASGRAVVTINGKDHYLGKWRSKARRAEYDRLIGEWLASKRRPAPGPSDDLTIAELTIRYWQFAKSYYRKEGRSTGVTPGIRVALRLLRRRYGRTPASDFGPLALQALQHEMVEGELSRTYINNNVARIQRMFRWAVSQQLVPETVYRALAAAPSLKKGRTEAREPEPIGPAPDEVVDTTLPHLPPVVADMVRFHRLAGCRPSEVCTIRPCDIDRSGEVWCYVPGSHKTEHHGRERRIYIGPRAQKVLLPYLLRDADSYCFSPAESQRKRYAQMRAKRKTPVQPSQADRSKRNLERAPGDHYSKDSHNRAIGRACRRAGIPVWHPNQLRHKVATSVRSLYGIGAAQTVLGHSNADVTQVYAERDFELAKRIMRRIG